jgi:hypothetical protein
MGIPVPFRSLYSDNHAAQEVAIKPRSVHGSLPAFASVKLQAGHHLPGFPGPSHWGLSLSLSDSLSGPHLILDDSESHASAHSDRDNRAVRGLRAWPVAAGAGPGPWGSGVHRSGHWPRMLDSLRLKLKYELAVHAAPGISKLPETLGVAGTSEWPRPEPPDSEADSGSPSQGAIQLGEGLDLEPAGHGGNPCQVRSGLLVLGRSLGP